MRYLLIWLSTLIVFPKCTPPENRLPGSYAAEGNINTYDTIILHPRGVYERFVYDKTNKPALHMQGNWAYENGLLTLHSFFLNLDRDLIAYPELLSDTGMLMETNMETDNGSLRFCTGYLENQNCYRKTTGNRNRPGS